MDLFTNSRQDSNIEMLTSLVPIQQDHHFFAPKMLRNQHEASYPNADIVIAVSPTTLLDPNRFLCEVCYKGFSRKQNLTLHRRAHNLPFNLKTRTPNDPVLRKVYLCPEPTCIHHNRSHALGDFGGLKKHYLRKHSTEKKYVCYTCSKAYSVETDLRAHSKICARKKYICHCGSRFSRGYQFNVHQENCDTREHVGAAKDAETLHMGEGSAMSLPPTLGRGDNTIQQRPQLCQYGVDLSSIMTNPFMGLNLNEIPPAFIPPTSTHQNQQACGENFGVGFYADLLMDKVQLHNVNLEGMSLTGDCGNVYESGEGSNSSLDAGFMFDPSSSLNLTPVMQTSGLNGMLNPLNGSSDVGTYEQGGYSGYGDGSGPFGGSLAPSEWHLNQQGFWF